MADSTSQKPADAPATTTRNIIILGGSFAGLGLSHYILKHVLPKLNPKSSGESTTPPYKLVIVEPSSHFWFHIAAPRSIVALPAMPHNIVFRPIAEGFKDQYPESWYEFIAARATGFDSAKKTVTIMRANSDNAGMPETLSYEALVIATGTSTPTALTSFKGDCSGSQKAISDVNERLKGAKEIVIAGGGPIGVEIAGEFGERLNGYGCGIGGRKVSIKLVAGGRKLLPVLAEKRANKAAEILEGCGVEVLYGKKVTKIDMAGDEKRTTVTLDDDSELGADLYIPATGSSPNTDFVPNAFLDERGHVNNNKRTLRVDGAEGGNVYAVGDVGAYTRGGVLDLYKAVPVVGFNIGRDLGAMKGGKDREHVADETETQLVPIGSKKGVGAFKGWNMPGVMVSQAKGKKYLVNVMKETTHGTKYTKP